MPCSDSAKLSQKKESWGAVCDGERYMQPIRIEELSLVIISSQIDSTEGRCRSGRGLHMHAEDVLFDKNSNSTIASVTMCTASVFLTWAITSKAHISGNA